MTNPTDTEAMRRDFEELEPLPTGAVFLDGSYIVDPYDHLAQSAWLRVKQYQDKWEFYQAATANKVDEIASLKVELEAERLKTGQVVARWNGSYEAPYLTVVESLEEGIEVGDSLYHQNQFEEVQYDNKSLNAENAQMREAAVKAHNHICGFNQPDIIKSIEAATDNTSAEWLDNHDAEVRKPLELKLANLQGGIIAAMKESCEIGKKGEIHLEIMGGIRKLLKTILGGEPAELNNELAKARQEGRDSTTNSITITAKELREAVEFVNPDADDPDQQETEVVIWYRKETTTSTDGDILPIGWYCHLAEYPEEGCIPLSASKENNDG